MAEEDTGSMSSDEVQDLVNAAMSGSPDAAGGVDTAEFDGDDDGRASSGASDAVNKLGLLGDVDLHVKIELGRTQMLVEDVLRLSAGSIVELNKLAGDPVDVYVNDRLIARGEVLVLSDNFCIRISEIVADLEEQAAAAMQSQQPGT